MFDTVIIAAIITIIFQVLVFLVIYAKASGTRDEEILSLKSSLIQIKKDIEENEEYENELGDSIVDLKQDISNSLTRINTALTGLDGSNGISGRLSDLIKTVNSLEKEVSSIQTTIETLKSKR